MQQIKCNSRSSLYLLTFTIAFQPFFSLFTALVQCQAPLLNAIYACFLTILSGNFGLQFNQIIHFQNPLASVCKFSRKYRTDGKTAPSFCFVLQC